MVICGIADTLDNGGNMYFQFLLEDYSTEILVNHVVDKLREQYPDKEIYADLKSFHGIGHLVKKGTTIEQKTGKILNDLPMYLRAFDKRLCRMESRAALIIVLDNDKREQKEFLRQLEQLSCENMILTDHVFCVAVKEMEAWLLGDVDAIELAYPNLKKSAAKNYVQDAICDTWEVLANMVYPGVIAKLMKNARNSYSEIGRAKAEWADMIGKKLNLFNNRSASFQFFVGELIKRIEAVETIA